MEMNLCGIIRGKRIGGERKKRLRRGMGILLAAAMVFNTLPLGSRTVWASEPASENQAPAASGSQDAGICGHHLAHTADCGYAEAHECAFVCGICGGGAVEEEDGTDDSAEKPEADGGAGLNDEAESGDGAEPDDEAGLYDGTEISDDAQQGNTDIDADKNVLSLNLGKENRGLAARLYYYNISAGRLELQSASKIAEDGTASFAFTHASEYVIVLGEKEDGSDDEGNGGTTKPIQPAKPVPPAQPAQSAQPESGSTQNAAETKENNIAVQESPKTGQERKNAYPVAAGGIILAGAAIAAILAQRKKKDETR